LVGVHGLGGVAVGGDLPARQVHGFQASLGLLHGLAGRDGAERVHIALLGFAIDQAPEFVGTALGQGVLDVQAATQAHDVGGAVAPLDAFPARVVRPVFFEGGDLLFAAQLFSQVLRHEITP